MRKTLKRTVMIVATLIATVSLLVFASFVYHKIQLMKEDDQFVPKGKMVEVHGNQMHVFTEGSGEKTLVFLSGGGTSSPMLDFKSLYTLLSDDYKIVVIEKAGYGFSDITGSDRKMDTILSETREALTQAEINGPFILFPHSMSGIEALYWEQRYPDEVEAIVGLDMAVPKAYKDYDINMPLIHIGAFAANVGITRWMSSEAESNAIQHGTLTEKEKALYKVITHRRTSTENMVSEVERIKENAANVDNGDKPDVPMLLFSSTGEGTGMDKDVWTRLQESFIANQKNGTLIRLEGPHYIHNYHYERIAGEAAAFIDNL